MGDAANASVWALGGCFRRSGGAEMPQEGRPFGPEWE